MKKQVLMAKFDEEVKGKFTRYGNKVSPQFGDYKWFWCRENQDPLTIMKKYFSIKYERAFQKWCKQNNYAIE